MATNNATNTSNPVTVAQGGTGDSSILAYNVVCGGTTSTDPLQVVGSTGTTGQVLASAGAGMLPGWINASGGSSNPVLIQSQTASSSANIVFNTGISSTYSNYIFVLENVVPASASFLAIQISTNGGSSWITAGGTYAWNTNLTAYNSTSAAGGGGSTQSSAFISALLSTSSSYGFNGTIYAFDPTRSSAYKYYSGNVSFYNNSNIPIFGLVGGSWTSSGSPINAFRFIATSILGSTFNIASGTFSLYGLLE